MRPKPLALPEQSRIVDCNAPSESAMRLRDPEDIINRNRRLVLKAAAARRESQERRSQNTIDRIQRYLSINLPAEWALDMALWISGARKRPPLL